MRRGEMRLGKADYQALAAFRHALRRFTQFSAEAARKAGLTPQQHQALLAIKGGPRAGVDAAAETGAEAKAEAATVGEIAAALLIRPHSAVELVDRLAELGLVRRIADARDHRRVRVALSARAEALLGSLTAAHLHELATIRPMLLALLARFGPAAGREPGTGSEPPGSEQVQAKEDVAIGTPGQEAVLHGGGRVQRADQEQPDHDQQQGDGEAR
jgi:DNA-binding MarR family transcriptional regulator